MNQYLSPAFIFSLIPLLSLLFFTAIIFGVINSRKKQAAADKFNVTESNPPYRWKCQKDRYNKPVRSTLSIAVSSPQTFRLLRECTLSRLAKWLGFATKFQTGSEEFDDKIFIESDDDAIHGRLQNRPELRKLILELFASGIRSITLESKWLAVDIYPAVASLPEEVLEQRVENLNEVKRQLISSLSPEEGASLLTPHIKKAWQYPGNTLAIIAVLAALNIATSRPMTVDKYRFSVLVMGATFSAVIAVLAILQMKFRSSSLGYKALRNFLLVGCLSLAFITADALYNINIRLDSSALQITQQRVISKFVNTDRKSGSTYTLYVEDWHNRYKEYPLTVNRTTYMKITPNRDAIRFYLHPGRLGVEWIEHYEVVQP